MACTSHMRQCGAHWCVIETTSSAECVGCTKLASATVKRFRWTELSGRLVRRKGKTSVIAGFVSAPFFQVFPQRYKITQQVFYPRVLNVTHVAVTLAGEV